MRRTPCSIQLVGQLAMALAIIGLLWSAPAATSAQDLFAQVDDVGAADGAGVERAVPEADAATEGELIRLNFKNAPLDTVLQHLSDVAGLVIVKAASADARVTVISRQPMTVDEAITVLNSVLRIEGLAAVRAGRTLKVVPMSDAAQVSSPVHIGSDPTQVPETDEVLTQVVPIRNIQAGQLVKDLEPLLGSAATMTANADSNTLVVTGPAVEIKRIVRVIAAMDKAQASAVEVRVFALKYAQATQAARLITEVFNQQANARNARSNDPRQRFRNFFSRGRGGENEQPADGETAPNSIGVTAAADERTNTVVVSGPPDLLGVVEKVVAELDSNTTVTQGVFIYEVKNGEATNLAEVLNNLFGGSTTGATASRTTTNTRGNQRNTQANARGRNAGNNAQASTDAEGLNDLFGQVFIVPDEDSNSLLVMSAPSHFEQIRTVIEELDKPVPQVLIKVLLAEVTHTDNIDLGVEFSVLNSPDGSELFTNFGLDAATNGFIYRLVAGDVQATLRALQEQGKLEVLSRPYILASDNQASTITVGSEVPFITSTQFTELGGTRNTVRYEDVGIILNVTPQIAPDGRVTMQVEPEISALSGETVVEADNVFLPVIEKRSASTRVVIRDGQTIVIGGLMEDKLTEDVDKIPLLGDLPLIGAAFQRQRKNNRKTELLIFLTPHVVKESDQLGDMTESELKRVKIVPDAIRPGAYQEHLMNMQRPGKVTFPLVEPEVYEVE